jgi:hypothetical protein
MVLLVHQVAAAETDTKDWLAYWAKVMLVATDKLREACIRLVVAVAVLELLACLPLTIMVVMVVRVLPPLFLALLLLMLVVEQVMA